MPSLRFERPGDDRRDSMISELVQFGYLQLLDFLTTIAFLIHGLQEGNPFVRLVLQNSPNPVLGLLAVKIAAVVLAVYCVRMEKRKLLVRINLLFAALVAWNLVALIFGSVLRTA